MQDAHSPKTLYKLSRLHLHTCVFSIHARTRRGPPSRSHPPLVSPARLGAACSETLDLPFRDTGTSARSTVCEILIRKVCCATLWSPSSVHVYLLNAPTRFMPCLCSVALMSIVRGGWRGRRLTASKHEYRTRERPGHAGPNCSSKNTMGCTVSPLNP